MERYDAYKDSGVKWIGEIPEEWDVIRTKHFFQIKKRIVGYEGPTVLSITQNGIVPKDITSGEGQLAANYSGYQWVYPGDFAMNHMDLLTGWVDCSSLEGITSPDYRVFAPIKESIDRRFYTYVFQHCYTAKVYYSLGQGVSGFGRWRLPADQFNSFLLPSPPQDEQTAIADYLDAKTAEIDSLVVDCEREVELLREYRKAVISEAVTRGLNPDAPMKDSGVEWIGEIPESWKLAKIKTCCDVLSGYAFKSELFIQDENDVKLLRGINLGVNEVRWDECIGYPDDELDNLSAYELKSGDVVIGLDRPWISGGLRIAMITERDLPCFLVQRVARLRGSERTDVRYILYSLASGILEYELDSLTTGVSVPHISTEQIGATRIALPSSEEQYMIVEHLNTKTAEIDSLIEMKQQMAEKLREYRRSLISEAVTGKFKVPGVE